MLPDGKHLIFYLQRDNAETAGMSVGASDSGGTKDTFQEFEGLSSGTKRRWQISKGGDLPRGLPAGMSCSTSQPMAV
jgi:hypothetical protein